MSEDPKWYAAGQSHAVYFDVETSALPLEYLDMITPTFEPPGNYKDPEKIAANIAEQKLKWIERAALSPVTGKVLCIGVIDLDGSFKIIDGNGDEKTLLQEWTDLVERYKNETLFGWNIWGFDLNFLQKRAAKHGVKPCIRWGFDFYKQDRFIDLMNSWSRFDNLVPSSLDAVAKFFGVGEKTGSGKDFAPLWESDRASAEAYLKNDVTLVKAIAEKMNLA